MQLKGVGVHSCVYVLGVCVAGHRLIWGMGLGGWEVSLRGPLFVPAEPTVAFFLMAFSL